MAEDEALVPGRALTASELAHQAGVTPQTASSHLSKLEAGGLYLHFDTLARNTIALLDHLQIAKAEFVAHSLGGMLGVRIARAYPRSGATECKTLVVSGKIGHCADIHLGQWPHAIQ